ncbi:MAG: hypothetical protein ACI4NZ_02665, partial [Candidatus Enterousia sp.]
MKRYFLFIATISAVYAVIKMLFFTPDTIAKVMVVQHYQNIAEMTLFTNSTSNDYTLTTNIPKSQREQYDKLMSDPKYRKIAQDAFIQDANTFYHKSSGQQFQNSFRRLLAAPFDRNMKLAINLTKVEKYNPNSEKFIDAHIELEDQWQNLVYIARVLPNGNPPDYKSFGAFAANGIYSFMESFVIGTFTGGMGTVAILGMDIYIRPKLNRIIKYVFDTDD